MLGSLESTQGRHIFCTPAYLKHMETGFASAVFEYLECQSYGFASIKNSVRSPVILARRTDNDGL